MLSIPAFQSSVKMMIIIIHAFALLSTLSTHAQGANSSEHLNVKRSDFPKDFVFGISTAAPQVEGSTTAGGRGPSVWDAYVKKYRNQIEDQSDLEIATDSYKLYKEDVAALKAVGVDVYRFSISWTRIFPDGTLKGGVNQEGVNYYNNLINELINNGIKPFVTLFHFDSPQALEEKYGGFLNRKIVEDFKEYADFCFKTYGDRVKNWITLNEPLIITKFGYCLGTSPPMRCANRKKCPAGDPTTEPYIAAHNLILAHATAAKLYKQKYQASQKGQIGWSLVGQYFEPYSDGPADIAAAQRGMDFELGWYLEPLVRGDYPESMKKLVEKRLPVFSEEEKRLVKGSFDFIGINYYTTRYARDSPGLIPDKFLGYLKDQQIADDVTNSAGVSIGENPGNSAFIYAHPEGLYEILKYIQTHYGNIPIYITENGVTEKKGGRLKIPPTNDKFRIEWIQKHLYNLKKAMSEGANVKGYIYWSLCDEFEWNEGFVKAYGLYYVDYKNNSTRVPKDSAKWYHNFLKGSEGQRA